MDDVRLLEQVEHVRHAAVQDGALDVEDDAQLGRLCAGSFREGEDGVAR